MKQSQGKVWCLLAVLLFISCSSLVAQRFSQGFSFPGGGGRALLADLNNDGYLDVFVTNSNFTSPSSSIYKNEGNGNYTLITSQFPGAYFGSVDIEDYDHDGLIDILISGGARSFLDGHSYLYKNKGNFVFENVLGSGVPDLYQGKSYFGDFNNDGNADLLSNIVDANGGFEIYKNDGKAFSKSDSKRSLQHEIEDRPWADVDADGDLDFITIHESHQRLVMYRNDGFENFTGIPVQVPSTVATGVKWADINNDALPDLIVNGVNNNLDVFHVLINQGNAIFTRLNQSFEGFSSGSALPLDIDSDGDTDLIIAGQRNYGDKKIFNVLYTNINGAFIVSPGELPSLKYSTLVTADIDKDNDLDVIISGDLPGVQVNPGRTYLYLNQGAEKNMKPTSPATSSIAIDGQKATITWSEAADQQSPSQALTYNVFVGTSSSNYNILSPVADANGLKASLPGNAGTNLFKIIDNLNPGTYYYRIQTVDGSFGTSVLSDEKQFSISPQAPVLSSFQPSIAYAGDTLFVTGRNFMNTSAVSINNVQATFKSTSSTEIRVIVPSVNHSGRIEIITPLGVATSSGIFCERPAPVSIIGEMNPCFGDVTYKLSSFTAGVNYHWSVDNAATILSQTDNYVRIRFPARATYKVSVYPESCVAGTVSNVIVETKGPLPNRIVGDSSPLTEVPTLYSQVNSSQSDQRIIWEKDNELVNVVSGPLNVTWTEPGIHSLKMTVTTVGCPSSKIEHAAEINVQQNLFKFSHSLPEMSDEPSRPTVVADFDSDGDDDIMEGMRIRENVEGVFVLRDPFTTLSPVVLRILDYDNDNDIDLVILNDSRINLLINNGGLSFTKVWTSEPNYRGILAEVLDSNLDGKTDVAQGTSIYHNNGTGFNSPEEIFGAVLGGSRVLDYNADGYPDLLSNDALLQINGGESSSKFYSKFDFTAAPISFTDLDLDYKLDFIYDRSNSRVVEFSSGKSAASVPIYSLAGYTFTDDVTHDGYQDIISYNSTDWIEWIFNPDLNRFENQFRIARAGKVHAILDVDNDGKKEILFYEQAAGKHRFSVFENTTDVPIVAKPSGLTSTSGPLRAELKWDRVPGYTYNVVVGSSIGSTDIVSPLAELVSGKGMIYGNRGNADINNFYKLNLPEGTYYWSVQAIHASGTRSGFSEWKSLSVPSDVSVPTGIKLSIEPLGIKVSWNDNSADETGFSIERRTGSDGDFTSLMTTSPGTTSYTDLTASGAEELQYRVSTVKSSGQKLPSRIHSTYFATVNRFPYKHDFEFTNSNPVPAWSREKAPQIDIFDNPGPLGWRLGTTRHFPTSIRMVNGAPDQALVTPEFNLSGMVNPVFMFDYSNSDADWLGGFESWSIRIESSVDGGQTWNFEDGYGASTSNPGEISKYYLDGVPVHPSVKFRIRTRGTLLFDNFRVADGPPIVPDLALTQSAQNEVKVTWTQVPRATHYSIQRFEGSKSITIFPIEAQFSTGYFDQNVATSKTYSYSITAYNENGDVMGYRSPFKHITLSEMPFTLQSIPSMAMETNSTKEVLLNFFAGPTPFNDITVLAVSSNPLIPNVTILKDASTVKLLIVTGDDTAETTINVTASTEESSVSRNFSLSVIKATPAPSGLSLQNLCYNAKVSNLIATGTEIKWYDGPTGGTPLSTSTLLLHGNHYYASQTINGLESSSRLDVIVQLGVEAPTGFFNQRFCKESTVGDLIAQGSNIIWHSNPNGNSEIQATTLLVNGKHYYATQTVNGCTSKSTLDVEVTLGTPAPAGNAVQSFCIGATLADLAATGTDIRWYSSVLGGSSLPINTILENGKSYFGTQTLNGCESASRFETRISIKTLTAPVGNQQQKFCPGATVANLVANGVGIRWYSHVSGGVQLPSTTTLNDGDVFFGAQSLNNCESSDRFKVNVVVKEPGAPSGEITQTFCPGATAVKLHAIGASVRWYFEESGGTQLSPTVVLQNGETYFASQTIDGCESNARLKVTVSTAGTEQPTGQAIQTFCSSATISDLLANGSMLKWYSKSTDGSPLPASASLTNGAKYYASQTINGCESTQRLEVAVVITPMPDTPSGNSAQEFDDGKTIADIAVSGTGIKWYANHEDALAGLGQLSTSTKLTGATYFATQTITGCKSLPLAVKVTIRVLVTGLEPEINAIELFPNPVSDDLTIIHEVQIDELLVINALGQEVMKFNVGVNRITFDLSSLPAGTYTIKVTTQKGTDLKKIIKR